MPDIKILQPASLDEALSCLAEQGEEARVVAGGTALTIMLKHRLISPAVLLSLDRLDSLRYIRHEPGAGLRIGALTTVRDMELSSVVREANPTLAQTYGEVANVRVRNVATVGGNLSEADYASDPPSVLVAMRGIVKARSVRGEREIPVDGLFRDFYETVLAPDEILTEVIVPELGRGTCAAYIRYVSRSSEDRPCVGMSAVIERNADGSCRELRLVAGAVAATPQEIPSAEAMARGRQLTGELIEEIAQAYSDAISPLSDLRGSEWYRKQMIQVLTRRTIQRALDQG